MKEYSLDLRERNVVAVTEGQSKTAVSERFGVSRSTVKRYLKRQAQGRLIASKRPRRRRQLDSRGCEQLRRQVEAHHDWTLERHGVRISMDGKGRWIDNVFIERFWRSLKYEEVE